MPTDLLEERQIPRSAVRHRPIAPDALHTHVKTPRASRARQHHEPHTTGGPPSGAKPPTKSSRTFASGTWLIYLVLGMLVAMLLLWLGQIIWNWGQQTLDDMHYGRPRTTQVDHFVGHETGNTPSHFIAVNLNGQVYVTEIPGGSPNSSRLLVGPHLIGPGADLAPITLSFVGDVHTPDLVISVNSVQMSFHNTGTSYVPVPGVAREAYTRFSLQLDPRSHGDYLAEEWPKTVTRNVRGEMSSSNIMLKGNVNPVASQTTTYVQCHILIKIGCVESALHRWERPRR